jgi:hydrogenase maturation factor
MGAPMKNGKIAEPLLQRSIINTLKTTRKEVLSAAQIGLDCAVFSLPPRMTWGGTIQNGNLAREGLAHIIMRCVNNLAAAGMESFSVFLALTLTKETTEEELRAWMAEGETLCGRLRIQIAGGHTCVSPWVREPMAAVQGCGKAMAGRAICDGYTAPGQDIVLSKWIGLEGTALLAKSYGKELRTRYPDFLIQEAGGFLQHMSVIPEAEAAVGAGVRQMHDVSEGGIFGALWEMAEVSDVGLTVDLRKIPVKQETIEICEYFHISPYELMSGGSLLMADCNGAALVETLEAKGIQATVIGRFTKGSERIIQNGEEVRYLNRPAQDAIWTVIEQRMDNKP